MYVRYGTIDHIGVTAEGETMLKLDENVAELNSTYLEDILWDDDVYEKNVVPMRSEVVEVSRSISRNHTIKAQRDSTIDGNEKWLAAYRQHTAYGATLDEAIDRVVDLIKLGPNDYV